MRLIEPWAISASRGGYPQGRRRTTSLGIWSLSGHSGHDRTCCWSSRSSPPGNKAVNHENDDRPHYGADETGAFACLVPIESLPEIGSHERAHDAEDGRHDEARRLVVSRHDELRNDAGQKADDDGPDNAHLTISAYLMNLYFRVGVNDRFGTGSVLAVGRGRS